MKLTMLGTGHAYVTECYNTCFALEDRGEVFLVDGGGGSGILRQLKHANIDITKIRTMFVTHKHVDHILGAVWVIRAMCGAMKGGRYEGEAVIYAHDEVIGLLRTMAFGLLQKGESAQIDTRLHLVAVEDGETKNILGRDVTFFDIHSTKAKQFGFVMQLGGGEKLCCCGDEPYTDVSRGYAENSAWLMHEAFCLETDAAIFRPYEKHHSTAADAARTAAALKVKNLILYHTEDSDLPHRRERYSAEASAVFGGNVFIPDDLETFEV